ncbi:hypothetical protein Syun_020891 [Stephania yunnanensis]|uniref:Uncharacterized protein n=1 Tax=Stephania yunnanensis TaxID=152371 RepID=A0AAP0IEP1_9MAGN
MGRLCGLEKETSLDRQTWRHACCLLCSSCGSTRKPGLSCQCKQPPHVLVEIHALLAVKIGQHRHQFHGHRIPPGASRRLPFGCLLHILPYLP